MRPRRHCRAAEVGVCGTPVPQSCALVCAGTGALSLKGPLAGTSSPPMALPMASTPHVDVRVLCCAPIAPNARPCAPRTQRERCQCGYCTVTTFQDGKHRRQRVGRGGGKHGGALAQVEMLTDPAKIDRGRGRRSTNQAAPKSQSNQPRLQQVGTRPTPFGRADGGCTGRGVAAARRRHATAGALAATAALTLLSPPAAAQSTGGRRRPA